MTKRELVYYSWFYSHLLQEILKCYKSARGLFPHGVIWQFSFRALAKSRYLTYSYIYFFKGKNVYFF